MRSRARLCPLSALSTQVLEWKHPPRKSPEKWIYKGSWAVSPLRRGKCRPATLLQFLGLKEDVETEPVSTLCWVRRKRRGGDKRRGDSLLTSAFSN